MSKKTSANIVSVFGQIEGVVARAMAAEGLCLLIDRERIPPTARWNDAGEQAECALVLTSTMERLFDERVRNLRA